MTWRYDYIMDQIEKACQLIAAMISSKKIEQKQEAEINQTLADLTGLGLDFYENEKNAAALLVLPGLFEDDNKKAITAMLMRMRNEELYNEVCERLLQGIDRAKLSPRVREMLQRNLP